MWRKAVILILAMCSSGSMFIETALGGPYPTKPVEIVCPFTAGSSMDLLSRLVAEIASKYLGQPAVVITKPGAAGSIGAADVISSKPDGHKLFLTHNSFFGTVVKTQKVPFDPNDLTPIANFMELRLGMFVKGDSSFRTLSDLLDYGKKNPGKLKWGHSGRGLTEHINGLLMFRKAGIEAIDIPYKGSPEKLAAILGGHLEASCGVYGTVKDHVTTGKVRYLITFSGRRYGVMPDVPSAIELGFPEVSKLTVIVGFYAHKDTPEEIKKTLFDVFKKTYEDPEFKKGFEKVGEEPRFEGPGFMKEAIRNLEETSLPVLKESGLYIGK